MVKSWDAEGLKLKLSELTQEIEMIICMTVFEGQYIVLYRGGFQVILSVVCPYTMTGGLYINGPFTILKIANELGYELKN